MSVIKIDGVSYNVGEVSLSRDAEIIYDPLTAGVMLDFSEVDDAVATKYSYSFTVEPRYGVTDERGQYDAFYYDVTSPKSVRLVELPFGQSALIFQAKIKSVSDGLKKSSGISAGRTSGVNKWGGHERDVSAGETAEVRGVQPACGRRRHSHRRRRSRLSNSKFGFAEFILTIKN